VLYVRTQASPVPPPEAVTKRYCDCLRWVAMRRQCRSSDDCRIDWKYPDAEWDKALATNLSAMSYITQAAVPT